MSTKAAVRNSRTHRLRRLGAIALLIGAAQSVAAWRPAPTAAHHVRARADGIVITGTVRDAATKRGLADASIVVQGTTMGAQTDANGRYRLTLPSARRGETIHLLARRLGFTRITRSVVLRTDTLNADFVLTADVQALTSVTVSEADIASRRVGKAAGIVPGGPVATAAPAMVSLPRTRATAMASQDNTVRRERRDANTMDSTASVDWNREQYDRIYENPFLGVSGNPRSTFSVDVDRASYGNIRRFITQGQQPPADAVRIEEMVNYFPYALEAPRGDAPVAITTEVMPAPWQPKHQLVRVALQARRIDVDRLPPSNLVFLLDVSGSMMSPDKLPLVKESLRLLVGQLREEDRVAIVVYAGAAGLVLPSTSGDDKARIMEAIDRLEAGGSTAGGAGLELAYRTAREHFARGGNNRVILATDGDFNVGPSSDAAMERLIESKRAEGTYLTILGFGTGNYQDAKMQKLARVGNGNAAYVDDIAEARKVLVKEMGGTLVTVANDVKLQIEFNPAQVASYRLIGYEDRMLRDEDFNDDKKDAGDMGAGHTVTALYELVPVGVRGTVKARESAPLRYTAVDGDARTAATSDEILHVSLRYKRPGDRTSQLLGKTLRRADLRERASNDLRFAASVASFGMLLRDSEHKGDATAASVLSLARSAVGDDEDGYRGEFIGLVERWRSITRGVAARPRDRER